jgi:ketosteroid isomerase-like protein
MARSPLQVTGSFIAAINARDLSTLRSLMTDDHIFTDARGTNFFGPDRMLDNWLLLFNAFPQYWIHIDSNFANGNRVALFGDVEGKWRVDGQILPSSWKVAASWLAEVQYGKVRSWSIFCDTSWMNAPEPQRLPELAIVEAW